MSIKEWMIQRVEKEGPMEPKQLCIEAAYYCDASLSDAKDALRLLTNEKRSDRKVVHILDGRVDTK